MTDPPTPPPQLQWSAQFRVGAPQRTNLPGDKILLPASALEQLLSASSAWAAENARRDLPAYDPYNSATHSAYRQAESQYQDQKQQLPYPLMFRLYNPENGRVVYAGIREFSADDGEVVLSEWLRDTLGVKVEEPAPKEDVDMEEDVVEQDTATGSAGSVITVQARQLPKGTFVKLRPLEAGYDPEDWKALLEQYLRSNYTTLTKGEVLAVQGGRGADGKKEEFRFLVDSFQPDVDGICVVDTDLEADIEALNEEQARETLQRIAAKVAKAPGTDKGSSAGGELDLFNAQQGQVLPGESVDYQLPSWNRALPIEFELSANDDVETMSLLVSPLAPTQRAKPRMDEFVFADLDARPQKRIRLEPQNAELDNAEALFVSVHAFNPADGTEAAEAARPLAFTLRARHVDAADNGVKHDMTHQVDQSPPNPGDVQCKNCHHWIPAGRLALHEATCYRNNVLCPKGCGQVFQKRSEAFANHWHCAHDSAFGNTILSHAQHDAIYHPAAVLRCTDCATKETFSSLPALAHHRTTTCPGKIILCRFCHLLVPQEGDPDVPNAEALLSGLTPHELTDGARTTECHLCGKFVRLRDMGSHLKNHDLDRLARPPPIVCRNVLCGRTLDVCAKNGDTRAGSRMGQGAGNDLGLCAVCFGPLYVSMYDPAHKALKRRIERKYLSQLVTGCGKSWCRNEFCRTGRSHLDNGGKVDITTKEALPMIKPYLDGIVVAEGERPSTHTPLHFCVDEASQKRRNLAEMLAAEDGAMDAKGGYDLEWCVGALEAENGDLDAARLWLKNWAPGRRERR